MSIKKQGNRFCLVVSAYCYLWFF